MAATRKQPTVIRDACFIGIPKRVGPEEVCGAASNSAIVEEGVGKAIGSCSCVPEDSKQLAAVAKA